NRRSWRTTLDHHGGSLRAHFDRLSQTERSLDQHFPDRIAQIFHEKNLDFGARRTLPSQHTCRQYLSIVHHKKITGLKKIGQLVETAVGERAIDLLENEQSGVIARKAGVRGNQRGVKREIEFGELHQEDGGVGGLVNVIFCSSVPG